MNLSEFAAIVSGFDAMNDREKVRHFAWHLHSHCKMETFSTGDIRKCFQELRLIPPNVSQHLIRMADADPPSLIRVKSRFKLHRREMNELDGQYVSHPITVTVSRLLGDLPTKLPDLAERAFLEEAINCHRVKAFRATIVMTWNLTYDHLIHWIIADPLKVAAVNAAFGKRFQKKPPTVTALKDFEEIKEFDVVEACGTANVISSNVLKILREKLTKRNIAAHPSTVVITEAQANDVVTDLVNNVVLALK